MIQITLFYNKVYFEMKLVGKLPQLACEGSHGVMVSTLDFESSDPSSNLGRTWWECSRGYSDSPCAFWCLKTQDVIFIISINT